MYKNRCDCYSLLLLYSVLSPDFTLSIDTWLALFLNTAGFSIESRMSYWSGCFCLYCRYCMVAVFKKWLWTPCCSMTGMILPVSIDFDNIILRYFFFNCCASRDLPPKIVLTLLYFWKTNCSNCWLFCTLNLLPKRRPYSTSIFLNCRKLKDLF